MTNEEIISVFHAYHEAKVKTEKGTAPFHIMTPDMVCVRYNSTDLGDWHLIQDCQLLLTDLSLISDEHRLEAYSLLGVPPWQIENTTPQFLREFSPHTVTNIDDRFSASSYYKIGDYLRSKGYNIGYGKYTAANLVNEGVVIVDNENKGI